MGVSRIQAYWHERMDRAQERIKDLEGALMVFFRVLRGESSFVQNSYELHVAKADYGKARDIYDRRTGDVAQAPVDLDADAAEHGFYRDALIEECAKIADAEVAVWINGVATTAVGQAYQSAAKNIAKRIRALSLSSTDRGGK